MTRTRPSRSGARDHDNPTRPAVSDTAFVTAGMRARETRRPTPLFRDPLATVLAGEHGRDLADKLHSRLFFHGVIARTAVLDELIEQIVNVEGARCVVNLGAGLDTRPYRLDLPADLRWVEVDLPEVVDYKAKLLDGQQPRCELDRITVDVTDAPALRVFLERLDVLLPTLVVSEGLVTYLDEDEVAVLAVDLARPAAVKWWALDFVASSGLLRWANRFPRHRHSKTAAELRFASRNGADFFRPSGWEPVEVRFSWLEQRRLGCEPWAMRTVWAASPERLRRRLASTTVFVVLKRPEPG